MNKLKMLSTTAFRLMALMLCLAATIPQLGAQTYTVAGSDTQALGASWSPSTTSNDMSLYSGNIYYLAKPVTYSSSTTYEYKITVNHSWNTSYGDNGGSSNASYLVNAGSGFTTYVFNSSTHVPRVVSSCQTVVIAGDDVTALGSSTWNGSNTANSMTTTDGITYTLTRTLEYTSGGTKNCKAVVAGNQWFGTIDGNNVSYYISGAGTYTVTYTFNAVTGIVTVAVVQRVDYYVMGDSTNVFPNGWNMGASTLMDEANGSYSWSTNGVHLYAGTYKFKVRGSNGNWYPSGDNATFTITTPGTYNVTITFDGTNDPVATATLVEPDPANTYDIYVRYTGIESMSNVYAYCFDALGNKPLGAWGGTALSSMTMTKINSYAYYHVTVTSYDPAMKIIFNENQSSSTQTGNLTLIPGDNYFTYGGGSTISGPNSQADARTDMYLIGYANSQQWAANSGIEMEWDETNGYYKLEHVVLTAMSQFAFATELASTNDDWTTLNAHRLSSTGNSHWDITEAQYDTWLKYRDYIDDNHNWYVEQPGAYAIYVDPATRCIMVSSRHDNMYMSYGVNWTYENNTVQMTTVDGNVYQTTITLNNGDYFLFSTEMNDVTAWGATTEGYEITDIMIGFAQKLDQGSTYNFHFTGTSGKYIVVVNKEKGTVTLRKTADATVTKIFLEKTPNVTLDPAGGTYNNQTLEGKRGGIYAWNKLNLETQNGQTYSWALNHGPTNYTYSGEVGNDYGGDGYLKDMPDTTTADNKQWYAWTVSNSICEFYFIRNNQEDHKSQNIIRRAGELWFTWIDEDATFNRQDNAQHCDSLQEVTRLYYDVTSSGVSDCATMLEGHYYVYYTNTTGWDSVYCYAWHENPGFEYLGEYPGSKCNFVGYDDDGYEVWCYDFGLIEEFNQPEPTGVIFDNGKDEDSTREQTGDLEFDNGACYDYLGMIYLGNSLNAIINGGIVNGPKYTVEDDLIGVYYDDDAITKIAAYDNNGHEVDYYVRGALYAKDAENYSAKSKMADGTTDYVYDICAHPATPQYPGGSQVQLKRTSYDQSNWIKIVLSPNFDNTNAKSNADVTIDASQFDTMTYHKADSLQNAGQDGYLKRYVGKIIPGHSMSGNLVNNVNPQMHITNIARPVATTEAYEPNVYITTHFNDSVVFSYVHQDWSPGIYEGVYKTVPHLATDENGEYLTDNNGNYFVDYTEVNTDKLYKMFYVAPKPQEIAYITWAVFDHDNDAVGTPTCEEPTSPGAFYAPMNWNRKGQLWSDPNDPNAAWGETYGPFSNGYMQYGAFQVNWSLFGDENHVNDTQQPWYRIFKPGQAYKILALIRYAYGDDHNDVEYTAGIGDENYDGDYHEGGGNHVFNAPRRYDDVADMQTVPYDNLNQSKFIVFPLMGTAEDSNGSGMGNVTGVKEVQTARTVIGVHYYNMMGVKSDKPFDGINIVVTTYSDGSRSSKKILR